VQLPNPLIAGFNPDPSIVRVGDDYYLATSTFEYLPGLPIYHSTDLAHWNLIGHVITTEQQLASANVPTNGGAWAPTIRFHDGLFYVAVTDALGKGTLIFTAQNPAGPWSGGVLTNISGIDPDLAWNDNGDCYATFSGLILEGEELGKHLGIQQAKIDLKTGQRLEEPRDLWAGTGLMFPEAPHIYKIGDWWYLMIAEGGTERGHGVSISRSKSITGPFEGGPNNPFLSARSTARPIQNTGHGDLVQLSNGDWVMVLLGMRTRGMTRSFSSLGRETFATNVTWHDGWPSAEPVHPNDFAGIPEFTDTFSEPNLNLEWVSVRQLPASVSQITTDGLKIIGTGKTMSDLQPAFVGRRQRRLEGIVKASLSVSGTGGISVRYDENAHYDLEISNGKLIARSVISRITHEVVAEDFKAQNSVIELYLELAPGGTGFSQEAQTSDFVRMGWISNGQKHQVAEFDGRYLSAEVTCSFTGRVIGAYAVDGELMLHRYSETAV
jgi:beta-xylosidase